MNVKKKIDINADILDEYKKYYCKLLSNILN